MSEGVAGKGAAALATGKGLAFATLVSAATLGASAAFLAAGAVFLAAGAALAGAAAFLAAGAAFFAAGAAFFAVAMSNLSIQELVDVPAWGDSRIELSFSRRSCAADVTATPSR